MPLNYPTYVQFPRQCFRQLIRSSNIHWILAVGALVDNTYKYTLLPSRAECQTQPLNNELTKIYSSVV